MRYGYVRVSTKEQNVDRQITAMKEVGIKDTNIVIDRVSGTTFNRRGYKRLLRRLKEADELYIKSIDRLGRNYSEIIEQWKVLTQIKKVEIIVIDFPLLDTRKRIGGITGVFIADIVLQIMCYIAQIERENTHKRQMEGIAEARKRGVKFGRQALRRPDNFKEMRDLWKRGEISLREGGRRLGVSHSTFLKWLKEAK